MVERSDFTPTPDGGFESPGMWPGFGAIIQGLDVDQARKISSYPSGHAVIGSGPVYVTLYKQSNITVYSEMDRLFRPNIPLGYDDDEHDYWGSIEFAEYKLRYRSVSTDNYYIFAELEEPDGTFWTGFSGYGVGAGLENEDYHPFNTQNVVDELMRSFPYSFDDVKDPIKGPFYYEYRWR